MSWVDELKNGTVEGTTNHVPLPQAPLPRRICFAKRNDVSNPGISFTSLDPLCGQPSRQTTGDGVTFEKDLVTCPKCLASLQGQVSFEEVMPDERGIVSGLVEAPRPRDLGDPVPAAFPLPQGGIAAFLDNLLDVPALTKKLADLEGEAAAVRVLLQAARAREVKKHEYLGIDAREAMNREAAT